MKHIIRAIVLLIILYLAAQHYQDSEGILGLIYVLFIFVLMYLVAGIIGAIRRAAITRRKADGPERDNTERRKGNLWLIVAILFFTLAYAFKAELGSYSFKAFLFLDNLVKLSNNVSPLFCWVLLGLLAGAIYGSFVGWKKYKLHAAVNLIPIGIFILFTGILYIVNKPLDTTAITVTHNMETGYAYDLVSAEIYNAVEDTTSDNKPSFLLDRKEKTAWKMDIKPGSNTEIRFSFLSLQQFADKHLQFVGLAIKNGNRKSPQSWSHYARVQQFSIRYNGRLITNVVVDDKNTYSEEIKINPIPISSFDNISVSINAVYPGEKYPARVAVSELVPIVEYER